jgi:hypothetical protein
MAIATLSKFTVPLASDASASTQGMLMPKLKYRFRVMFENFGVSTPTTELTKQVQSAARPSVSFANQVIEIYNSKINYAGKYTWAPLAIVLRDDVTGNVTKLVGEQLQKQFDFFEQSSAAAGVDYKFTTRIEMLDGGNGQDGVNVLETWEVYGCYLVSANYQSLAYSEQGPATIDLSIQYDNAVQSGPGGKVASAQAIARAVGTSATGGG